MMLKIYVKNKLQMFTMEQYSDQCKIDDQQNITNGIQQKTLTNKTLRKIANRKIYRQLKPRKQFIYEQFTNINQNFQTLNNCIDGILVHQTTLSHEERDDISKNIEEPVNQYIKNINNKIKGKFICNDNDKTEKLVDYLLVDCIPINEKVSFVNLIDKYKLSDEIVGAIKIHVDFFHESLISLHKQWITEINKHIESDLCLIICDIEGVLSAKNYENPQSKIYQHVTEQSNKILIGKFGKLVDNFYFKFKKQSNETQQQDVNCKEIKKNIYSIKMKVIKAFSEYCKKQISNKSEALSEELNDFFNKVNQQVKCNFTYITYINKYIKPLLKKTIMLDCDGYDQIDSFIEQSCNIIVKQINGQFSENIAQKATYVKNSYRRNFAYSYVNSQLQDLIDKYKLSNETVFIIENTINCFGGSIAILHKKFIINKNKDIENSYQLNIDQVMDEKKDLTDQLPLETKTDLIVRLQKQYREKYKQVLGKKFYKISGRFYHYRFTSKPNQQEEEKLSKNIEVSSHEITKTQLKKAEKHKKNLKIVEQCSKHFNKKIKDQLGLLGKELNKLFQKTNSQFSRLGKEINKILENITILPYYSYDNRYKTLTSVTILGFYEHNEIYKFIEKYCSILVNVTHEDFIKNINQTSEYVRDFYDDEVELHNYLNPKWQDFIYKYKLPPEYNLLNEALCGIDNIEENTIGDQIGDKIIYFYKDVIKLYKEFIINNNKEIQGLCNIAVITQMYRKNQMNSSYTSKLITMLKEKYNKLYKQSLEIKFNEILGHFNYEFPVPKHKNKYIKSLFNKIPQ